MNKREPTNAEIMAEIRAVRGLLEELLGKFGRAEKPAGRYDNVVGMDPRTRAALATGEPGGAPG